MAIANLFPGNTIIGGATSGEAGALSSQQAPSRLLACLARFCSCDISYVSVMAPQEHLCLFSRIIVCQLIILYQFSPVYIVLL